ncbi:SUKH-3 domain-containing protein [Glycomyces luteolus]|uniref:SUKH-3 domain-containing protein n=2 Tax=Glycomyces luteolus TaxID=2670330 RepID=A0A9X3SRI0_9ACTN|nr:SUKH-3 domain-containing protein [Glycomyces luteolus]MDA1361677.1 SUKH-3 domain-containing protein [Glycomyces luteolus]
MNFEPLWANEYVRAALQMSGWTPDWQVDPTAAIDRLVAEGFTLNPFAVDILRSFHNIRIDRLEPEVPGAKFGRSRLAFRPEADAIDFVELVVSIEEDLGSTLFPIADADDPYENRYLPGGSPKAAAAIAKRWEFPVEGTYEEQLAFMREAADTLPPHMRDAAMAQINGLPTAEDFAALAAMANTARQMWQRTYPSSS